MWYLTVVIFLALKSKRRELHQHVVLDKETTTWNVERNCLNGSLISLALRTKLFALHNHQTVSFCMSVYPTGRYITISSAILQDFVLAFNDKT